ncbi:MAG TPA: TonB-dependent receptor [Puia sp.]|nr:TonB-dependent receptor [Puia sp.]
MKLTFLLLTVALMQVSARGVSQNVTLSLKNASLKKAFAEIRRQTGVQFFYKDDWMDQARKVDVRVKDVPLEQALDICFKDQPFTYEIVDRTVVVKKSPPAPLPVPVVSGMMANISGKVTNEKGEPLEGASVKVKGSTRGTVTDADGKFKLNINDADHVLVISFTGYASTEVIINGKASFEIILTASVRKLDEIVVVGYGQQRKAVLTGAISSLKGEEIVTTRNESLINMLAGKIPGVRVSQNSAEPGSFDNQFDIRGLGTPLVIVDGVPRDNYARLDPNDIEDLSVLKDASAAVYGVRAANGVVLITTKKGKAGTTLLNYEGSGGFQYASGLPKLLNIYQWMTLTNEKAIHNVDGGVRPYTQADFDAYASGARTAGNWYPAVLRNTAPQMKHSLSASGGTDRLTYYISLGYENQGGFWKSGDLNYNKYNVRSNTTAKISKRLTAELQLSAITDTKNQPDPNNDTWDIFRALWRHPPILPVYANNDPGHLDFLGDNGINSVATTNSSVSGYRTINNKWFQGSFKLSYDVPFIQGLKARGMFSYDSYVADNKQFYKSFNLYTYTAPNYTTVPQNAPSKVVRSYVTAPNTLLQYSLDYNHSFGKHNLSVLALYEEQTRKSDNFSATRSLVFGNLDQIASGSSGGQIGSQDPNGLYTYTNKGLVGKIHYDYKARYLIDINGRYDGSSKFPPGKQWGFFPGVTAGWRIGEEGFIKDNTALGFINNIKLRGSYGIMGDDGASQFQFIQGYDYPTGGSENGLAGGYVFNGVYTSALGFRSLPNANITWYQAKTADVGLDVDLWKGLLGFQIDWFQRNRTGLLANRNVSLPSSLGATISQENLNSDQARGAELVVTHNNRIGKVNYRISANVSYTKIRNLYVERAGAGNSYDNWRNNTNGRYNDIWWGNGAAGRFSSFSDIYSYMVNQGGGNRGTLPGDYKYQDWNGDGVIDALDNHPIANTYNGSTSQQTPTPNPGAINYGLTMDVEYRGFDVDILFQGVADRYIAYGNSLAVPLDQGGNALSQFMNRWHPADPLADPYNPNTTYVPGFYAMTGSNYDGSSAFAIQNASYLRLKAVTLGYSLPQVLLKKVGIQKARIYVNGYDILTITGLKFVDPEHPSSNYGYTYPLAKTFNAGISITF